MHQPKSASPRAETLPSASFCRRKLSRRRKRRLGESGLVKIRSPRGVEEEIDGMYYPEPMGRLIA